MNKFEFIDVWGKCLIRMRDDGLFALYTAALDCLNGEMIGNSMTVYSPDYNTEFLNKNLDVINNLIYEETLLDIQLEIKSESELEKNEAKIDKLKKYFGKFLIIKN